MSEFSVDKLALFPEKYEALKKACVVGEMDETYPVSVELSLTNNCNFGCVWCSDSGLRKRLKGVMKLRMVDDLLEDLSSHGIRGIVLEGGGEPSLYPGIEDVISRIRELGMSAGLITNGSVLNYSDSIENLDWIRISLDASTAHQMEELKKTGAFERVMKNISEIGRIKNGTVLGISYIVAGGNCDGLEEMIQRLRGEGVDYVQLKPVVDHPDLSLSSTDFLEELKRYENGRFRVFLSALQENAVAGNGGVPCVANSVTSVIAADGSVFFCGRLNVDPSWPALGNLDRQSFCEIWNGDERRRQSKLMLDVHECLVRCPECRLTKFNLGITDVVKSGKDVVRSSDVVRTPNFI